MTVLNPIDRFGNRRCGGYRKADFTVCLQCNPNGRATNKPDPNCSICGGYGEHPKKTK